MLQIATLQTQYKNLIVDEKRSFLVDLLVEFLDKGNNFSIIHRFISEHPKEANEEFLDEVFAAVVETMKEVYDKNADDTYDRLTDMAKRIRLQEQQERDAFNGDKIL